MRLTLFPMILMLAVAGCGYKGPLYLPQSKPAATKPAPPPPAAPVKTPAAEPPVQP